jgi:hypothetical protein
MVNLRFNWLYIATIAILTLSIVTLPSCSGDNDSTIPSMTKIENPPMEVDVATIFNDYIADEEAADSIYKGKRLLFRNILVEQLESTILEPNQVRDDYVMNDSVKFRARFAEYLAGYKTGFIVDIVGEVRGMVIGDILIIDNCWYTVIEGDIDTTQPPLY